MSKNSEHPKSRALWFANYDYGGPEDATKSGPGRGLYNGEMDKYKSIKDFLSKKRKRRRELKSTKNISDELLKAASRFSQLVAQVQMASGDATTLSQALKDANMWGGDPFDPNHPIAKKLFAILDKNQFQGKLTTTITVDNKLNVRVNTNGANSNIANAINTTFAPSMSAALKKMRVTPPTETMTFGWLEDVG